MNTSFERPYRPADLNTSLTKSFPLMSMVEKLMREATFATSGRAELTLAHGDELTVMKAGTTLEDHRAPNPATVITLSGSIIFTTSAEKITMEQGDAVAFTSDILHAVYASEDSAFLIIIGGKSSE